MPLHDDWRPTAPLAMLQMRAHMLSELRQFFQARGYWEVETPLLSRDVCVDAWIDPVPVPSPGRPGESLYLQTSPEFAMKRLLAAGAEAIVEITRSFRNGEAGPRHNLEFTIVEWYRAGDSLEKQMTLVEELVRQMALVPVGGGPLEMPAEAFPRFTYDEAAEGALGTRVMSLPARDLQELSRREGLFAPASLTIDDRDGWLNLLLAERIEPWLAQHPGCFLYDYPASQAALARVRPGSPDVAERFELYLNGVEQCNGYQELTDAEELERRMAEQNRMRINAGGKPLPVESRLLEAMRAGLPESAGVALGFDRLVMWRLGCDDIRDVRAFPFDRA